MWLSVFLIAVTLYSIFSYTLTDPNLLFSSWSGYLVFQDLMWSLYRTYPVMVTAGFVMLIGVMFFVYYQLITNKVSYTKFLYFKSKALNQVFLLVLVSTPLLFAYNALSHDIFNYMFNAKMVVEYGGNPHTQVALDFADDWTRFMHNTHTPAPYWYGWTAWSLVPYMLGLGYFSLTWLSFKVFGLLSLVVLLFGVQYAYKRMEGSVLPWKYFFLVFFNPLILIEFVGNAHNDGWMLALCIWSIGLVVGKKPATICKVLLSLGLLVLAISMKYVPVVIVPVWLWLSVLRFVPFTKNPAHTLVPHIKKYSFVFLWASILFFIPLLTTRSKLFLPWYLSWSFVWLPFIENKIWRNVLIAFSFTSMLRYVPWMVSLEYTPVVELNQRLITWSALVIGVVSIIAAKGSQKT